MYNKFSKWVAKTNQPLEAHCLICRKNVYVSIMCFSALESHAAGAKHKVDKCKKINS